MPSEQTTGIRPRFTGQRRASAGAALLFALLAIPIILACGATPTAVYTAPASALTLDINIQDQYTTTTTDVTVGARALLARQTGQYVLSASHTLTCDGIAVPMVSYPAQVFRDPPGTPVPEAIGSTQVPRQPPGGAYICVYTDEHGQRATLIVPVPPGQLTVTSPAPDGNVTVPKAPPFRTTPTPTEQTRDPDQVSQPPVIIRYTLPRFPAGATATFQVTAYCGRHGDAAFEECSLEGEKGMCPGECVKWVVPIAGRPLVPRGASGAR